MKSASRSHITTLTGTGLLAALAALFIFALPVLAQTVDPSTDATLSALSVSPKDVIGFDADRNSYEVGVEGTVVLATVTAVANDDGASVSFDPGNQVDLSAGRNEVTITVTAEDGATTREYTVSVNRGETGAKGWQAGADLDGLRAVGNEDPTGIWSDETTMWVADNGDGKLYAYSVSDGTRDASRDIALEANNDDPRGIWSDGAIRWVADNTDGKLYAYSVSDGTRDAARDIALEADNDDPRGIWSGGTTMWVADNTDGKLYAYRLSDGTRRSGKNFGTLDAAGNDDPRGIWSDGTTMWVADTEDDKLYAYWLSNRMRRPDKDLGTLDAAGNNNPRGIWSDGTTMWVADTGDDKLYAYNRPLSSDARLSALRLASKDINGFARGPNVVPGGCEQFGDAGHRIGHRQSRCSVGGLRPDGRRRCRCGTPGGPVAGAKPSDGHGDRRGRRHEELHGERKPGG